MQYKTNPNNPDLQVLWPKEGIIIKSQLSDTSWETILRPTHLLIIVKPLHRTTRLFLCSMRDAVYGMTWGSPSVHTQKQAPASHVTAAPPGVYISAYTLVDYRQSDIQLTDPLFVLFPTSSVAISRHSFTSFCVISPYFYVILRHFTAHWVVYRRMFVS